MAKRNTGNGTSAKVSARVKRVELSGDSQTEEIAVHHLTADKPSTVKFSATSRQVNWEVSVSNTDPAMALKEAHAIALKAQAHAKTLTKKQEA